MEMIARWIAFVSIITTLSPRNQDGLEDCFLSRTLRLLSPFLSPVAINTRFHSMQGVQKRIQPLSAGCNDVTVRHICYKQVKNNNNI